MIIKRTVLGLACALLSGCGNYGPLYLPKDEQKSQIKTTPAYIVKKTS